MIERQSGPKAKQRLRKTARAFRKTNPEEIIQSLAKTRSFTFDIDGHKISLEIDDFIISFDVQEGFAFSKRNNLIGIISAVRNGRIDGKGLMKDLARRLQTLRKERGYNPTDILEYSINFGPG